MRMGSVMWSEMLRRISRSFTPEQFVLLGAQVQGHLGAARLLADGFDGVVALARTLPPNPMLSGRTSATRDQRDAVRDDEGGVEADAELSDEIFVLGPVGRELRKELARARLGDGADVLDHFLS